MPEGSRKPVKRFEDITKVEDLINYLDSYKQRLSGHKYLYHYTTIESAINIIQSKKWHLTSARDMNDSREYDNGDAYRWKNLFFTSFMRKVKENIGMWSMYAQPWRDGVMIIIPCDKFRQWIEETRVVYEISMSDKRPTGRRVLLEGTGESRIHISTVAYSNSESLEDRKTSKEYLKCGSTENIHMVNATSIPELTGYVKDMAWEYEREVRIKAEFDNSFLQFERVAIDIPDYVIDNMVITAGPLFEGDLKERLEKEIQRVIGTAYSLYKGKLHIKDQCKECDYKKNGM